MHTALLLIALGFGFKIFAEASTNAKKSVKQLGRVVGIIIMLASLTGVLCTVWAKVRYGTWACPVHGYSHYGIFGKSGFDAKKMCPLILDKTGEQAKSAAS